jgi:hypothetical protein
LLECGVSCFVNGFICLPFVGHVGTVASVESFELQITLNYAGTALFRKDHCNDHLPCGRIPTIVAECGNYFKVRFCSEPLDTVDDRKHEAIEVEGVFRLNGAMGRIKHL